MIDQLALIRREIRLSNAGAFERQDMTVVPELPIEMGPPGGVDVF
jgi:hypothetical protein